MINLSFASEALPENTFQVLKFDGEEEMSHLFRFELVLVSRDPNIDFEQVLNSHASLAITTQGNTRYIHGMLSEFEQAGEWHGVLYEYRAVLVPRLWMLSQSRQNQIYQEQTVPAIVEGEIGNIQNKGGHPLAMTGLDHADYEMHIIGDYDESEYVVQYRESDFNFISRLMEHVGIYYYFEQDETREKIVITDAMPMKDNAEQAAVGFQNAAAASNYAYSVVYNLRRAKKQIPGSVLVKDYNYRSPSLPLHATDEVDANGIGFVSEYGAHFKTPEEGQALATVRAEEFRCRQNVYNGESNVSAFHCGHVYSLANHFRDEYNQDYLITKVVHHASQDIESSGNVGGTSYHNEFSCIPADIQYRPERLTPKPRLYGIMNGTIDSEQDMDRADLDEEGRYKVLMPFDISGAAPGKASRRIRMAQPYGGHGAGMSFPLVKGTEVIWTCIDGDIDRPIITGAVPNPVNPSVTTTENSTSNVIKTSSGITMGFEDGPANANQSTAGTGGSLGAQQQNQKAGLHLTDDKSNKSIAKFESKPISAAAFVGLPNSLVQQQQYTSVITDRITGTSKRFVLHVPDHELHDSDGNVTGTGRSYFSMGNLSSDSNIAIHSTQEAGGGIYSYTDGNRVTVTKGDDNHWHYGGSSDYYKAPQFSCFNDSNMEYFLGNSYDYKAGLIGELTAGVKSSVNLGIDMELNLAMKYSIAVEGSYTTVYGDSVELASDIRNEANDTITLRCDPEDEDWSLDRFQEKWAPGIAAVAAGVVTTSGFVASIDEGGADSGNALAITTATAQHVAAAALSVAASVHYYRIIKKAKSDDPGAAFLNMNGKDINFGLNGISNQTALTYNSSDDKTIYISARNFGKPDDEAVSVKLVKDGAANASNKIELQCGKHQGKKGSSIEMNENSLMLTMGECSIEMFTDKIEFKTETETFTMDATTGLTISSKGVKAESGEIKSKGGTISGKLTAQDVKASALSGGP